MLDDSRPMIDMIKVIPHNLTNIVCIVLILLLAISGIQVFVRRMDAYIDKSNNIFYHLSRCVLILRIILFCLNCECHFWLFA